MWNHAVCLCETAMVVWDNLSSIIRYRISKFVREDCGDSVVWNHFGHVFSVGVTAVRLAAIWNNGTIVVWDKFRLLTVADLMTLWNDANEIWIGDGVVKVWYINDCKISICSKSVRNNMDGWKK